MALPKFTDEERAANLEKAARIVTARAQLKARLRQGEITFAQALADPDAQGMKVLALLRALPGIGPVRAEQIMAEEIGIDPARRVRGLGDRQRAALEKEFAPAAR